MLHSHVFKNKKQNTKMFLIMILAICLGILSTTQGPFKLIECANHLIGSCIIEQILQCKGLAETAIISTYLQLVLVHLIT